MFASQRFKLVPEAFALFTRRFPLLNKKKNGAPPGQPINSEDLFWLETAVFARFYKGLGNFHSLWWARPGAFFPFYGTFSFSGHANLIPGLPSATVRILGEPGKYVLFLCRALVRAYKNKHNSGAAAKNNFNNLKRPLTSKM